VLVIILVIDVDVDATPPSILQLGSETSFIAKKVVVEVETTPKHSTDSTFWTPPTTLGGLFLL
jgi:hypothetical protein